MYKFDRAGAQERADYLRTLPDRQAKEAYKEQLSMQELGELMLLRHKPLDLELEGYRDMRLMYCLMWSTYGYAWERQWIAEFLILGGSRRVKQLLALYSDLQLYYGVSTAQVIDFRTLNITPLKDAFSDHERALIYMARAQLGRRVDQEEERTRGNPLQLNYSREREQQIESGMARPVKSR